MKRFLLFLFVLLLTLSLFRSLNGAQPLSFNYVLRVIESAKVNLDLSEFAACLSDIANFFTGFSGAFPEFTADNIFDAIKSTALYIRTFMEMFANFAVNLFKLSFLVFTYPIRALWTFINVVFQLLGIDIGTLPHGYGDGWRGGR